MVMKIQFSLLILLSIVILHTEAILPHRKDQNLIETTCKNTPNYQLCIATIRADPGSNGADLPGLGQIVVRAVEAKTKEALSAIGSLSGQPKLAAALRRCNSVYKAVLEGDVPVAKQVIRGNPKFAETAMADAAVEAGICQGAFGGAAVPPPLGALNRAVVDLAGVARAIIRNLL